MHTHIIKHIHDKNTHTHTWAAYCAISGCCEQDARCTCAHLCMRTLHICEIVKTWRENVEAHAGSVCTSPFNTCAFVRQIEVVTTRLVTLLLNAHVHMWCLHLLSLTATHHMDVQWSCSRHTNTHTGLSSLLATGLRNCDYIQTCRCFRTHACGWFHKLSRNMTRKHSDMCCEGTRPFLIMYTLSHVYAFYDCMLTYVCLSRKIRLMTSKFWWRSIEWRWYTCVYVCVRVSLTNTNRHKCVSIADEKWLIKDGYRLSVINQRRI